MDKLTRINLLYDFYGQMLTDKQRKFVELYYCHDLSLGEISEQHAVSRQSVYDTLKRSEQSLVKYEEKLGLVAKFLEQRECLDRAISLLEGGSSIQVQEARKILSHLIRNEES
ncbi:MAG: YlxM family DNA-binding protein [Actinobacteria bacterium]|nr:YlxM family DNA-binding protein [Actinomycetota bacterium]